MRFRHTSLSPPCFFALTLSVRPVPQVNIVSRPRSGPPPGTYSPRNCQLQRHGARYPNLKEGEQYALAVKRLGSAKEFKDKRLEFLRHYEYDLQADGLTPFGAAQCVSPSIVARFVLTYDIGG